MRGKRTMLLVLGAVLVATGIVYLAATGSRRMPSYQGKSLDYWLNQMPVTILYITTNSAKINVGILTADGILMGRPSTKLVTNEPPEECTNAIRTMGTKALPILLAKLQAYDIPWETRVNQWGVKLGVGHLPFEPAVLAHSKAIMGLEALQPLPEEALQQLRALSTNADPSIAASAKYVLSRGQLNFGAGSTNFHYSTTTVIVK